MKTCEQFYIGGAWRPSTGKGMIDVIDSGTEAVIGRVPEGTAEDAKAAVAAARAAFDGWAATPPAERARYL
ncbi:aldehyde dehydrogenase family protein, partial [Burkholderia pseudomallei]